MIAGGYRTGQYNGEGLFQTNRGGTWQAYVMDTDGSEQTKITDDEGNDYRPNW